MRRVVILIVLLALFGGCTMQANAKDDQPAPVIVSVSTSGYEPATLEISPNTEVIFINHGSEDFWPATNHHPTHTLFDGTSLEEHCSQEDNTTFDACGALHSGEQWSFVFIKPGTFPYHDHLWPHLKGTVIVTQDDEATSSSSSLFDRFVAFSQRLLILVRNTFFKRPVATPLTRPLPSDPYARIVAQSDPHLAIEALKRDTASSSELFARCHESLHAIGKEAFYQYGSFGAASVFQNDFCNSGYIHGVFEAYFSDAKEPTSGLVETCLDYAAAGGRPFDLWQCHHGVGHGFMYYTGGDLPEALKLCSDTFVDESAAQDCHNGVYMEIFNSEILALEPEFLDPHNPAQVCTTTNIAVNDCFLYLPVFLFNIKDLSLPEIVEVCESVALEHRDACKLGASTETMKRSMAEPEEVFTLCGSLASVRDQITCVAGAVTMYVNQTASLEAGYELCERLPRIYKEACKEVVDGRSEELSTTL